MTIWERVTNKGEASHVLDRIAVPGGWVYRTFEAGFSGTFSVALTFVPTPAETALDTATPKKGK